MTIFEAGLFVAFAAALVATLPRLLDPLSDLHDFWPTCWCQLLMFGSINGLVGIVGYLVLTQANVTAHPQVVGGMAPDIAVSCAGARASPLLLRFDGAIPSRGASGPPRQSIFTWATRHMRAAMY